MSHLWDTFGIHQLIEEQPRRANDVNQKRCLGSSPRTFLFTFLLVLFLFRYIHLHSSRAVLFSSFIHKMERFLMRQQNLVTSFSVPVNRRSATEFRYVSFCFFLFCRFYLVSADLPDLNFLLEDKQRFKFGGIWYNNFILINLLYFCINLLDKTYIS